MTRSVDPVSLRVPDDFRAFYERELDMQVRRAFLLTGSNELANDVVHDAMVGVFPEVSSRELAAAAPNATLVEDWIAEEHHAAAQAAVADFLTANTPE